MAYSHGIAPCSAGSTAGATPAVQAHPEGKASTSGTNCIELDASSTIMTSGVGGGAAAARAAQAASATWALRGSR